MVNIKSAKRLSNGIEIPVVGFGVWDTNGPETYQACIDAIEAGYRLIDTAMYYGNEEQVGRAVRDSKISREDIFVTSKIWYEDMTDGRQEAALEASIQALDIEYIDLFLLHWPIGDVTESWKVLEKYYQQGLFKAIGVSNFKEKHLKPLEAEAEIMPMVNQIEINPFLSNEETVHYCQNADILVEAWGPFGKGRQLSEPVLEELAHRYHKTTAQIILRWDIQRGIVPLAKSVHKERMISNLDVFDFELSQEDMNMIYNMNRGISKRATPKMYN